MLYLQRISAVFVVLIVVAGVQPVQAQTYGNVYVQAGGSFLEGQDTWVRFRGNRSREEEAPSLYGIGPTIRAGWTIPATLGSAFYLEVGYQRSSPRSASAIADDMQPTPTSDLLRLESSGSGDVSTFVLQGGGKYAPRWGRIGIVQTYALGGAGLQITSLSDYEVEASFEHPNPDSPLPFSQSLDVQSDSEVFSRVGGSIHGGLGADAQFHSRYSLFAEMRAQFLHHGEVKYTLWVPHVGISYALDVEDGIGRF